MLFTYIYLCISYEKTKGHIPLGLLLGKQNIQAKEVYSNVLVHVGVKNASNRLIFDDNENESFCIRVDRA